MAAPRQLLLQAVDRALAGDWQAAHVSRRNTRTTTSPTGSTPSFTGLRATLSNARYWFRQAGRQMADYPTPEHTLRAIKAALES